jgi:hypothetical protein
VWGGWGWGGCRGTAWWFGWCRPSSVRNVGGWGWGGWVFRTAVQRPWAGDTRTRCAGVTDALKSGRAAEYEQQCTADLMRVVDLVRGELTNLQRATLGGSASDEPASSSSTCIHPHPSNTQHILISMQQTHTHTVPLRPIRVTIQFRSCASGLRTPSTASTRRRDQRGRSVSCGRRSWRSVFNRDALPSATVEGVRRPPTHKNELIVARTHCGMVYIYTFRKNNKKRF